MPVITKISTQKKNKARYNIFLDGAYAFSVDEDVLLKFQLKKGKEFSEEEITRVQHEDDIRKAYHSAIHFLSFRMRSALEIRQFLQKKEWSDSIIDVVIKELDHRNYINDLEFAKAYVRTYASSGKKGPMVIRQELLKKGVTEPKANEALLEYKKEQQVADAIQMGNKYVKQYKKLSERMLKQKVEYTLSTKGFPADTVSKAMEEIEYEKAEDEEWETIVLEALKMKRRYSGKYTGYEYEQRMKQALFRKGFTVDLINRFLEEDQAAQEVD